MSQHEVNVRTIDVFKGVVEHLDKNGQTHVVILEHLQRLEKKVDDLTKQVEKLKKR